MIEYFRAVAVGSPDAEAAAHRGEHLFEALEWSTEYEVRTDPVKRIVYRSFWKFRFWTQRLETAQVRPDDRPDPWLDQVQNRITEPRWILGREQLLTVQAAQMMTDPLTMDRARDPEGVRAAVIRTLTHPRQLKPGCLVGNHTWQGELTRVAFAEEMVRSMAPLGIPDRLGRPIGSFAPDPALQVVPPDTPQVLALEWFLGRNDELGTLEELV